jgi:hypothetical protein
VIYGLLLQLYPRTYLQRHREELLQNFQDLEQELPSRVAVWWFIARDLAVSLRSELSRTFWGQTAIVFTLLSLLLAVAHLHPGSWNRISGAAHAVTRSAGSRGGSAGIGG